MLFSSLTFIIIFLPLTLIFYFINKNRTYRNIVLLIASLIFYAWGEPKYILLMLISILVNYIFGRLLDKNKKIIIPAIIFNILLLVIFKYLDFSILNLNNILNINIPLTKLPLPIGISFYTFQILSYIIDVYRKKVKPQKNILNLALYISLFPQLIAGPIVRYKDIEKEIKDRKETITKFSLGLKRFIIGLAKKVIIANNLAIIADYVFDISLNTNGTITLWIGALAFMFQIYADFSGYSDMAIGLGKMFGFTFKENFNYPYTATTITDFFKRWHISLSSWFKDYVYISLGGSKVKTRRWIINMIIVWFLTGLWHGANITFVIWGLYFAVFLILEKLVLKKIKIPKTLSYLFTMFIVLIGWVIFRANNLTDLSLILKNMFIYTPSNLKTLMFYNYEFSNALIYFIPAIIISFKPPKELITKLEKYKLTQSITYILLLILFVLVISVITSGSYNPFIYFRF